MNICGHVQKMHSKLDSPVQYELPIGEERLPLNPLIGKKIQLNYLWEIRCIYCDKKTNKTFNQGYCFPCFRKLARCDSCIIKPEQCHYHLGTCREPKWGEANCMQPHYIYFAQTSELKVGVTRKVNIPMRWIDQGAHQALAVFELTKRKDAGTMEVLLAQLVKDKTNWRKMLQGIPDAIDLIVESKQLLNKAATLLDSIEGVSYKKVPEKIVAINYPVESYPVKVSSINLEKTPNLKATLLGIKGQYLIFDIGMLNVRKYAGYLWEIKI